MSSSMEGASSNRDKAGSRDVADLSHRLERYRARLVAEGRLSSLKRLDSELEQSVRNIEPDGEAHQ